MSTKERDFSGGSRHSSSVLDRIDVARIMLHSFYLPIDILKSKNWEVKPIRVITGKEFFLEFEDKHLVHCNEGFELLCDANYVAVSERRSKETGKSCYVCKIWYGAAPK